MRALHPCLLMLVLLARDSAAGQWDYAAGAAARSLPQGGALVGQAGYGQLLWGEAGPGKFRYGYVRPSLLLQASGVVNRAELWASLHPISFLGLHLGRGEVIRWKDPHTLDCAAAICQGAVGSNLVRLSWVLGAGLVFAGGSTRIAWLTPSAGDRPFADEVSVLVGAAGGDRLVSNNLFAGVALSERYRAAFYYLGERMIGTGTHGELKGVVLKISDGPWAYVAGTGLYESTFQSRGVSVFGTVQWTGLPALGFQ